MSLLRILGLSGTPKSKPTESKLKNIEANTKKLPKNIEIKWLNKQNSHLAQIYNRGLEMCFVSNDWEQGCVFVLCKDFLHDAIMAAHYGKSINIHGFRYNPKTDKAISLDRVRIAVVNSQDKDLGSKIPKMIEFLNQIESELHLVKSQVIMVDNPPPKYKECGAYIVDGSSKWIISPPMISLFALMVRCGMHHKKGDSWRRTVQNIQNSTPTMPSGNNLSGSNDKIQLRAAMPAIENILKNGYAKIFYKDAKNNYPNIEAYNIHGSYGICGFSRGTTAKEMPYWHRDLNKATKLKSAKPNVAKDVTEVKA